MKGIATVAAVVCLLAFGPGGAAAHDGPHVGPDGEVFNVGKNGDVKIGIDVVIGNVLVKKGKYLLEHQVDGDAHILVLTGRDSQRAGEARVYRIRMRLIPSRDAVKKSALFAERVRNRFQVTVVQVAGEGGDHIPDAVGGE